MTAPIVRWWSGLSLRERWLVGIAGGLSAIVIGWLLIALPVQAALSDAREQHGIAVDRHAAVLARVEALEKAQAAGARAPAPASSATLDLALAQSATERGFALSRNDPQGSDTAAIAIANARAPAMLAWLTELESSGMAVSELTLRPNADGTVALTATVGRGR